MVDITLCVTKGCPLKKTCQRHRSRAGYWQSWSRFTFDIDNEGVASCNYYYPTASPATSARNGAPVDAS
jgi:hypothetical protein